MNGLNLIQLLYQRGLVENALYVGERKTSHTFVEVH
jgi:hypothetical protein